MHLSLNNCPLCTICFDECCHLQWHIVSLSLLSATCRKRFFAIFSHAVQKMQNCNWIITFVEGCAVDHLCISKIKEEEEDKTFLFLSCILPICRRCWRLCRLAWRCRLERRSRFPAIGRRRCASSSPAIEVVTKFSLKPYRNFGMYVISLR